MKTRTTISTTHDQQPAPGGRTPSPTTHNPRRSLSFSIALAILLTLAACTDDPTPPATRSHEPVTFRASRETVARTADGGEAWAPTDRVGIFLVTAGGTLPDDLVAAADNVPYTALPDAADPAVATFTPSTADTVYYPTRGKAFAVAYYPWRPTPDSDPCTYKINVTDQHDPAAIDVQYAKSGDSDKTAAAIDLAFRHVMSKLVLNTRLGDELLPAAIDNAPVIGGIPATATLALADGTLTPGIDPAIFAMHRETTTPGFDATFSAILVPQANGIARYVTFTVDGNPYTWHIPDDTPFPAGTCHTVTVTIRRTGITVTAAEITPWTVPADPTPGQLTRVGIRSAADLVAFSDDWNAAADDNARAAVIARWSDDATPLGTVRLLNDIDMNGVTNFTPIGMDLDHPFTGTFDGGGYTISNLTINVKRINVGLFGYNNGTIRDITLANANISTDVHDAGGIAGDNSGSITGCTVTDGTIKTFHYAGGIAGLNTGSISGCTVTDGTITNSRYGGGIAGDNSGSISGCTVTDGTITAPNDYAGGIAGLNNSSITGCTVTNGTINSRYAGGIAGWNRSSITGCTVTDGTITSPTYYAGGIAGSNQGSITGCTVTDGTITSPTYYAGGIAGSNQGSITGCIATPKEVSGTSDTGICAGRNKQSITACYGVTIVGISNVGDGDDSGCTSFDKANVKEMDNFFTAGNPSPIERMNTALEAAGAPVRWTAGNADSGWYPVIQLKIEN